MKVLLLFVVTALSSIVVFPSPAQAGYVEVGASGTYRRSNFDPNSYDQSYSLSGSVSYLFSDSTAIEASYTDGFSKRFVAAQTAGAGDHITSVHTQFIGCDFVFTFGAREDMFRPYLKAGMGYIIKKKLVDEITGYSSSNDVDNEPHGFVPSAGAGFRIAVTERTSLKIGLDMWNSDPIGHGNMSHFDVAARAGISWLF